MQRLRGGWVRCLYEYVRLTRIKYDSVLAIVLSTFFGFGLVLHTLIQRTGNANQAGLDTFLFGQAATILERDVLTIGVPRWDCSHCDADLLERVEAAGV